MGIGRICRLRLPSQFNHPAMWLGIFAFAFGAALAPALAQGPPGAVAAATGAAAAATVAAPAPRKTAASAALDAAVLGESAVARAKINDAAAPTEEATNGPAPAGGPASPAAAPTPPLTGVAAQCADLLKMATDLKAEVDKTTKDVLSVAVIRDAGEIEDTAKKMRQQH